MVSLLIKSLSKCNGTDCNLVRLNLATELPLNWLHWISIEVIFLEECNCTVSIANSKVFAIVGDNKLSDWELADWPVSCFERSI